MLTDRQIKSLRTDRPQVDVFDGEIAGFGVRVTNKARKSFFLFFRSRRSVDPHRRLRRVTLGTYPYLSLSEARERAQGRRLQQPAAKSHLSVLLCRKERGPLWARTDRRSSPHVGAARVTYSTNLYRCREMSRPPQARARRALSRYASRALHECGPAAFPGTPGLQHSIEERDILVLDQVVGEELLELPFQSVLARDPGRIDVRRATA
jgi:Arm DNA-binding domain